MAVFGPYALDLCSGELNKHGTKMKLGEQPFQILLLLLQARGELVTREELRARLWSDDTFVDFDRSLNSAVQRLRDCLSDTAGKARWIETVPRRGYRFVGRLEATDPDPAFEVVPDVAEVHVVPSPIPGSARSSRTRIAIAVTVALVLLLAAVPIVRRIHRATQAKAVMPIRSLAVLPLENLSGDPAQEYFADGMTDEVITMLAKNPSLRVTSRTSVMQYKKVHRPLKEVAKELGVEGILEGSVGRVGNRVHMTAQLIHAASDTHVWAESFDRDLVDVSSLQTELAQVIARQVGATTSGVSKPQRHVTPEAHDAYLLGRYYWFASEYEKGRQYFQKAIDLQPDYAAAWSGLADSYSLAAEEENAPSQLVMPRAEAAAKKALEFDELAAEAHNSMAMVQLFYRWDWAAAERESARAIELKPSLEEAHFVRSYVLRPLNRMDEALQEEKKAMELDPFSNPDGLVWVLIRMRRFGDAVDEARVRSDAQPKNADLHEVLAAAYFCNNQEKEWEAESERALQLAGERDHLAQRVEVYRRGGLRAVLDWKLDQLKQTALKQYVSPVSFAEAYAELGRKEETLRYLEKSYEERDPHLVFLQSHPDFDFVHADPRYRAIVKKMRLPAAY
ncbi:MAG TPA: winged helix-turn-helix domain-containing protein [Terriglobales bacterium]|nr:winged helix-turn-helix domain-containing protein [Terriglobales bacterium]